MKKLVTFVIALTLVSACISTSKKEKRETILPGAPNMGMVTTEKAVRASGTLSAGNISDVVQRNLAICKSDIAATIFSAVEESCLEKLTDYESLRPSIEDAFALFAKDNIDKSEIIYKKITKDRYGVYTSFIVVELKRENFMPQLRSALVASGTIPANTQTALFADISQRLESF